MSQQSGSAAAIKTFKNTELGETWVEEGEAPDWQRLLERREDYRIGTVPAGDLRQVPGVAADGVTPLYPAGYVHLPMVDAEFVQQLCAEQLVTRRDRHGFAVREWQKTRERNDSLDCRNYARAAAAAAGLDCFEERHWRELERQLGIERPPDSLLPQLPDPATATEHGGRAVSTAHNSGRRLIKSRWLNQR